MKSLSHWGSQHPVASRWIIFACFVVLNYLAIQLAWWSMVHNRMPFQLMLPLGFGLGFTGLFLYPVKRWKGRLFSNNGYYRYQKTMDGLLVAATFLIVFSGTQRISVQHDRALPARAVTVALDVQKEGKTTFSQKVKKLKVKAKEKIQTHIQKKLEKHSHSAKALQVWAKILISLGALALGVLVWYIIIALGCSVSCSGNGVLGSIIMIGGTVVVIAGLVWAGFEIWKRRGPKPEDMPAAEIP
jgi:hypothetical protein